MAFTIFTTSAAAASAHSRERGSGIFAGGWGAERAAVYGVEEEKLGEFYAQRTLLKREVLPEHCANAVFALCGPDMTHTTGLHIPVDAGVAAGIAFAAAALALLMQRDRSGDLSARAFLDRITHAPERRRTAAHLMRQPLRSLFVLTLYDCAFG